MPSPSVLAQIEEDEDEARRIEAIRAAEEAAQPLLLLTPLERLEEFAYQLAGGVMGIAMRDHPDYEFPTEETVETVKAFLAEFGFVPPSE